MKKIKVGIMSEEDLVNSFGTSSQKKSYKEKGRFINHQKETILKNASCYCDIEEVENKRYKISNIKKFPMTKNYKLLHDSLYQYICPQILIKLIKNKQHFSFTAGRWAREIDMVNDNYNTLKTRSDEAIRIIKPFIDMNMQKQFILDFYNHADNMITNYITNALKYMESQGLIIWQEVYMVVEQEIKGANLIDGNVDIVLSKAKVRRATEEDMDFYAQCIGEADKSHNINCDKDRYYSNISTLWKFTLHKKLAKKNIQKVYKTYEVYTVNYKKCQDFLNTYNNLDTLIDRFNIEFSELIKTNAAVRYDKNPDKYKNLVKDYIEGYACFTSFTIGIDDEKNCEKELDLNKDETVLIENRQVFINDK